jgi:hypothetical protein
MTKILIYPSFLNLAAICGRLTYVKLPGTEGKSQRLGRGADWQPGAVRSVQGGKPPVILKRGWEMAESQTEFDVRILRFKVQNLESLLLNKVSETSEKLAGLEARLAALEESSGAAVKPARKSRASAKSKEPGFAGI